MVEYKRLYTKADVLALIESFSAEFRTLSQRVELAAYAEKLAEHADVIVMENQNEVIGMAAMYVNDLITKTAYISLIGIRKEHQGTGCGTLLLRHCILEAQKAGMEKIRLEVDDSNINARKFYHRHGFVLERASERNSCFLVRAIGMAQAADNIKNERI